uniref:Uncharacterized protein n=1 Tax=Hanusia phi TaxID=3032 RepID=A0A7S0E0I4_9CRYP|mmetsp:Transcript_13266/g.30510  ORF Transcript_13266/g.30510 Transcript_13266/m.30510 type:complete len:448 (+) Transcript_13266:3-1346(+)|eukprot:766644-Hanusia_phi.AAC.3
MGGAHQSYGTAVRQEMGERRSLRMSTTAKVVAAVALFSIVVVTLTAGPRRVDRTVLSGRLGNDAGPSSRWEGSNLPYGVAVSPREAQTGYGAPGWEPGPDYYSTANWDNAALMPSLMHPRYDPYIGKTGCPTCSPEKKTYMFSVDPRCDNSPANFNIRQILKMDAWWKSDPAVQAAIYQEYSWIGAQVGLFMQKSKDVVMVVPPCFFPRLANTELNMLNTAVYGLGGSLLILGGLTGADFISQNLEGSDGYGYVDSAGSDMVNFSPKFDIDCVWSGGPFYMQNSAISTEFFYGPKYLEGSDSTWGIPVNQLPPETIHYYMSADEVSIVFEIPAKSGRILFMGYDFQQMLPNWIDALLLARRELQIEAQYPPGMTRYSSASFLSRTNNKLKAPLSAHVQLAKVATKGGETKKEAPRPDVKKRMRRRGKDALDREIEKSVDKLMAKQGK